MPPGRSSPRCRLTTARKLSSITSASRRSPRRWQNVPHGRGLYSGQLNPEGVFGLAGTVISVANTGARAETPVSRIIADKARKQVRAYDAGDRLLVAYPATIGSADTRRRPARTWSRCQRDAEYTYNPKINFQQGENDEVLRIPPGPNGPVGSVWIGLSEPTFGIHGTPEPSISARPAARLRPPHQLGRQRARQTGQAWRDR